MKDKTKSYNENTASLKTEIALKDCQIKELETRLARFEFTASDIIAYAEDQGEFLPEANNPRVEPSLDGQDDVPRMAS